MMLRRLKEDVEKNLAPKEETIIEVGLRIYHLLLLCCFHHCCLFCCRMCLLNAENRSGKEKLICRADAFLRWS